MLRAEAEHRSGVRLTSKKVLDFVSERSPFRPRPIVVPTHERIEAKQPRRRDKQLKVIYD